MQRDGTSESSFLESERYKKKVEELLKQRQIMLIMISNDIVIRISHAKKRYCEYCALRERYMALSDDERIAFSKSSVESMLAEEIVYHVRKAVDEMIYSLWIKKIGISKIDNTKVEKIDSIGEYLKQSRNKNPQMTEFDEYMDYFDQINKVSNSYKHSLNMFSHFATDLSHEDQPKYFTYTISDEDAKREASVGQTNLIIELESLFDWYLTLI